MAFYAKPSGGYTISSFEGSNNIIEAYNYLSQYGYTKEAVAGMMGNVAAESGLNPWRWENNTVNYNKGYGLFQFTPASGYIPGCNSLQYYAPSLNTGSVDPSADPDDAKCQLYVFATDYLHKWDTDCWRDPDWDPLQYPDLYAIRNNILFYYGSGTSLSVTQFAAITNVDDACFAFLGCYEKPLIPNYYTRRSYARDAYDILQPYTPGNDILLELKILDRQRKRRFNNI